jgi:hypothetical protein
MLFHIALEVVVKSENGDDRYAERYDSNNVDLFTKLDIDDLKLEGYTFHLPRNEQNAYLYFRDSRSLVPA